MNKALLVGINTYPGAPLRGCVNDVVDMSKFIVKYCGFEDDTVRLLTDVRATKDAIVERLGWLLTGVRPGDRIFFHYSGHGAQMGGRNPQGEVDRIHDVICPVDFDWSDEHAIKDTDFQALFDSVPPGVIFNWVSDSCHSGHLIRGLIKGMERSTPKALVPPADIAWQIQIAKKKLLTPLTMKGATKGANVALIGGCQSNQTSADAEFNGIPNGALTYYLLQELGAQEGLKKSLNLIVKNLTNDLTSANYEQIPQIEGSAQLAKCCFLSEKLGI